MKRKKHVSIKQFLFQRSNMFLTISWIVSWLISVYLGIQYFRNVAVYSRPFSPWIVLYFFPFFLGLLFLILLILDYKRCNRISDVFEFLSRYRRIVAIILLGTSALIVHLMSNSIDLSNELINLGMSGIGIWLYSMALILIVFTILKSKKEETLSKDRFFTTILILIAMIWLLMSITKFGLEPDTAFWNVAGVPVLWTSLATILFGVLLFTEILIWTQSKYKLKISPKHQKILEILLIFSIWLIATIVWINTPYGNSYFFTKPSAITGDIWPYSDARTMDLGGQSMIIGGRLETPYFTEKPFYALFLGLIHLTFGQSYQIVTNVQIMVLALIPVFLYLIGKMFAGRSLGLGLATFAIVKESNAIYSTFKISVSNSRLLMTELPSALVLVILAYVLFKWLRAEHFNQVWPVLTGLTLGVGVYLRSNFIVVLIAVIVFLVLSGWKQNRIKFQQIGLFILSVFLVILPWTVYSQIEYGKDPLTWKVQAALDTRFFDVGNQEAQTTQEALITQMPKASATPSHTPIPSDELVIIDDKQNEEINNRFYKSKVSVVAAHYLNNQVKALFSLPFQVYPANLDYILEQDYWRESVMWNGLLPIESVLAFATNLILISVGLTYTWKKFGWVGLTPLLLQTSYYFSNALVRTSGSRYLVAVDWVNSVYFFLGIFFLFQYLGLLPFIKKKESFITEKQKSRPWLALSLALLIGLSLPVINLAFPQKYTSGDKLQVFKRLPIEKINNITDIKKEDLETFVENPQSRLIYGRGIYPQYVVEEDPTYENSFKLTVMSPKYHEITLPQSILIDVVPPAGEDVIVLGCDETENPEGIIAYLLYFVQSDQLIWSTASDLSVFCDTHN